MYNINHKEQLVEISLLSCYVVIGPIPRRTNGSEPSVSGILRYHIPSRANTFSSRLEKYTGERGKQNRAVDIGNVD